MEFKFQSIQESEEFKGYENDLDKYAPKEPEETYINQYGVRMRGKKIDPNHDDGDEPVIFTANRG